MVLAQLSGNTAPLLVTMWLLWAFTVTAFFRALDLRPTLDRFDGIVTLPLFAIFSGWISAAAWVNTVSWLRVVGAVPSTIALPLSAGITIVLIGGLSLLLLRRAGGYVWYGAATLWALVGIAYANVYDVPNRGIAALAVVLAVLVIGLLLWSRRTWVVRS
jgi:hypothetical protein